MSVCSGCGAEVTARFCGECGLPAPSDAGPPTATVAVEERPRRRGMSRGMVVAVTAAIVGLVVAGGAAAVSRVSGSDAGPGAGGDADRTISGTMVVAVSDYASACGQEYATAGERLDWLRDMLDGGTFPCPEGPGGGYSDISDGTQVTVKDAAGTVLAAGTLTGGTITVGEVAFTFTVEGVPDADLYQVEVSRRGALSYTADQMDEADWSVNVSLG
jgi:hypothetical protein